MSIVRVVINEAPFAMQESTRRPTHPQDVLWSVKYAVARHMTRSNRAVAVRRQEMFDQPDMPDAAFIEEMDALIPDMYTAPGGGDGYSPPSAPEDGSLPASGNGSGAQGVGAPGSTQSEHPASGGGVAAQAAQHDASKPVQSLRHANEMESICTGLQPGMSLVQHACLCEASNGYMLSMPLLVLDLVIACPEAFDRRKGAAASGPQANALPSRAVTTPITLSSTTR